MNKTLLWVVIGVVVVGGGIAIAATSHRGELKKDQSVITGEQNVDGSVKPGDQSQAPAAAGGKKMAFGQFVKQGGSYQCTVDQYLDNYNIKTTGTVYLDSGKIRGSFSTNYNNTKIDAYAIVKDGFAYSWTSMGNMGFKTPVVETDGGAESNVTVSGNTYNFNMNQIGDYNCEEWKADASVFVLPTSVTFQTIAQ